MVVGRKAKVSQHASSRGGVVVEQQWPTEREELKKISVGSLGIRERPMEATLPDVAMWSKLNSCFWKMLGCNKQLSGDHGSEPTATHSLCLL